MRERGAGTIINLSSVFGRFAIPGNAYYAASKHAVAAFTDALRLELAGFGIRAVLIESTAARTSLHANLAWAAEPRRRTLRRLLRGSRGLVRAHLHRAAPQRGRTPRGQRRRRCRCDRPRRHRPPPRARYEVGTLARALFALRRWLPAPARRSSGRISSTATAPGRHPSAEPPGGSGALGRNATKRRLGARGPPSRQAWRKPALRPAPRRRLASREQREHHGLETATNSDVSAALRRVATLAARAPVRPDGDLRTTGDSRNWRGCRRRPRWSAARRARWTAAAAGAVPARARSHVAAAGASKTDLCCDRFPGGW